MSTLIITPKFCKQDEKVCIRACGLTPHKPYTLTSHLQEAKLNKYFAYAHYIANFCGIIDVGEHESVGGHYTGIFQMGLIGALQPVPSEPKYLRIFKRDVHNANKIEIRLYEGFKSPEEIFIFQHPFKANDFHYRYFMGPGVKRVPIKEGNVRGTLFIPAGNGPFPGVIDMFGTSGGLLEYRSAQLATRGIASLALAFFDYEDLPKYLKSFDLKYFEEAVHILLKQEKVLKPHVGVIGVSKGGDLALTMATFIPQVALAVSINGSCSTLSSATKINEKYTIPALLFDMRKAKILYRKIVVSNDCIDKPEDFPKTIIPVNKSNSQFLFIVGEDDLNIDSKGHASVAAKYLDRVGKSRNYEMRIYKGAGHLIEPPYSAFCFASYHRTFGFVFAWGGELKAHTEAQETAWLDMLNFIKKHLRKKESKL